MGEESRSVPRQLSASDCRDALPVDWRWRWGGWVGRWVNRLMTYKKKKSLEAGVGGWRAKRAEEKGGLGNDCHRAHPLPTKRSYLMLLFLHCYGLRT